MARSCATRTIRRTTSRELPTTWATRSSHILDAMGNHSQEQVFDPRGKLAQTRTRVYDNLNRLSQDIGGANPDYRGHQLRRDSQGNLTSVTDPLGHVTNNVYDALNRLSQVIDPAASGSGLGGTTQYFYDGVDQLSQVLSPRGVNTVFALDGLGNLNWRGVSILAETTTSSIQPAILYAVRTTGAG